MAAAAATGALLAAQAVRAAGRAEEDRPGLTPTPAAPSQAQPASAATAKAPVKSPKGLAKAPAPRVYNGYAAEAARSSSRLPPDERATRAFLRNAAVVSRIESEASRLAAERAGSDAVRAFAADLLQAQQTSGVELLHLLNARDMAAPMLETAPRKALGRLARLDGRKFDRAYLELVLPRPGRDEVAQYQRAAQDISDPVVKAWIEQQLPALREQHATAQRLASGRPPAPEAAGRGLRLSRTIASNSR